MEDKIMNNEEVMETEETVATEGEGGMSTGVAMLIGGGLALACAAGVKKLKKVIADRKAKKAAAAKETEESKDQTSEEK